MLRQVVQLARTHASGARGRRFKSALAESNRKNMKKKILATFFAFLSYFIYSQSLKFKGADISYLNELEDSGAEFFQNGQKKELFEILKDSGVNWIRLRLWHTPKNDYCSTKNTILMATRAKSYGFKILLDFHYSDSWADPEQQKIPKAWENMNFEQLESAVYDYTQSVLQEFIQADCSPDMVQIGNEIINGMLWPFGSTLGGNCSNLMKLIQSGCEATRKVCPNAKIMLHLICGNNETLRWWFSQAKRYSVDYDVIGLSYYAYWHGASLKVPENAIKMLKKNFSKPVCIVETHYPWTLNWQDDRANNVGEGASLIKDFSPTPQGQKEYLRALCSVVQKSGGSGIFWWEPDMICTNSFKSDGENLGWFDFNHNYNGTANVFKEF